MKIFRFGVVLAIVHLIVLGFLIYRSSNGLGDLLDLRSQMARTENRIERAESENLRLRQQIDLMKDFRTEMLDDYARSQLGYIKEGEVLYLESVD